MNDGSRRTEVYVYIREHPGISSSEIVEALGIPQPTVCLVTKYLRKHDVIIAAPGRKRPSWRGNGTGLRYKAVR